MVFSPSEKIQAIRLRYPGHSQSDRWHDADLSRTGQALYQHAIRTLVPVSSTRTAEMTKLLENIHRAVNIGLVNEMKIVADKMGINIHEVIRAAATKPFGFTPYSPGQA